MIQRLWWMAGWLGVAITLIVSLMPPALDSGGGHADKIVHLLGYALLTFWWAQLITGQRWKLAAAVVLFGIAIEGLQFPVGNDQELIGGRAQQVAVMRHQHQRALELCQRHGQRLDAQQGPAHPAGDAHAHDVLRRMQGHQAKKRPLLRALKSWNLASRG